MKHLKEMRRKREERHEKCKIEIFSQHIVVSYLQSMLCYVRCKRDDIRLVCGRFIVLRVLTISTTTTIFCAELKRIINIEIRSSSPFLAFMSQVQRVARCDISILIQQHNINRNRDSPLRLHWISFRVNFFVVKISTKFYVSIKSSLKFQVQVIKVRKSSSVVKEIKIWLFSSFNSMHPGLQLHWCRRKKFPFNFKFLNFFAPRRVESTFSYWKITHNGHLGHTNDQYRYWILHSAA